jgi:hypothetical protein
MKHQLRRGLVEIKNSVCGKEWTVFFDAFFVGLYTKTKAGFHCKCINLEVNVATKKEAETWFLDVLKDCNYRVLIHDSPAPLRDLVVDVITIDEGFALFKTWSGAQSLIHESHLHPLNSIQHNDILNQYKHEGIVRPI